MPDYTHYETQPRQRLTTDALNALGDHVGRAAIEGLRRLVNAEATSVSGVIDGLLVTVAAGTMNVLIGGGLALLYDSAQESPNNRHRWIEVDDAAPLPRTLDAGGASPRWDVIEIAPGVASGPGEVLDVYNPQLGAPEAVILSPLKNCTPVVTITKGTPAANPKFPAGTAGRIPLAYVYVPAAAVVLLTTDVLYCRPILRPLVDEVGPGANTATDTIGRTQPVTGGGLALAAAGTAATIASTMSGRFTRSGQRFVLPAGTGVRLSVNNCDGGLPIASKNLYFYAVPPSAVYPSGYSSNLAERELIIPTASRIASGGYATGQYHCFVVASDKAPETSQRGQPSPAGTFDIVHPTMDTISIDTYKAVYIGCAYYDFGATQLLAQIVSGSICSASRVSGSAVVVPTVADTVVTMHTNVALDPAYRLPAHVRRVHVQGFHRLDVQGDITVLIKDAIGVATGVAHRWSTYRSIVAADLAWGINAWMILDDAQSLTINYADGNGTTGSNTLRVLQWEDPVLESR